MPVTNINTPSVAAQVLNSRLSNLQSLQGLLTTGNQLIGEAAAYIGNGQPQTALNLLDRFPGLIQTLETAVNDADQVIQQAGPFLSDTRVKDPYYNLLNLIASTRMAYGTLDDQQSQLRSTAEDAITAQTQKSQTSPEVVSQLTEEEKKNIESANALVDGSQNATTNNVQGNGFENPPNINGTANNNTVSSTVTDMQKSSNSVDVTSGDTSIDSTELPAVTVTAKREGVQVTTPNPLHDYVNYTYSISLHIMSESGFAMGPNYQADGVSGSVLIASAGRYDNSSLAGTPYQHTVMVRNPAFNEDFYFDELKITTVIGTSFRNRNSNAVDLNFTIIEPNGFTLINRLLDACSNPPYNGKNYLMQPYLLQIDFYGYNEAGHPTGQLLDQTKKIPISLIEMKSRITSRGTEYRISAVPYNHRAFSETTARTPANFQIKANSLTTFFGQGGVTKLDNLSRGNGTTTDPTARAGSDIQQQLTQQQASALLDRVALDKGYINAMNSWNEYLKTSKNRTIADQYEVKFAPEILAEQNLIDKKQNPTTKVANNKDDTKPDWSQGLFQINTGTTIESVIEMAVRNSDYILNQVKDPTTDDPGTIAQKIGKPLKWFKIVPKLELIGWDPLANDFAKKITYNVKPWTVNNIHPNGPLGSETGAVKEYNYLYTGKNNDVLDLSIDFNMQYYVQLTVDRNKNQATVDQARTNTVDTESYAAVGRIPTTNVVNPLRFGLQSQDVSTQGQFGTLGTPKKQTAADLNKNLTGTSRGDMINVKLRIVGDPHFIKQDDIFYDQTEQSAKTNFVNNSLVMDSGELYVSVKFNTPIDYDERYGIATSYDQETGTGRYGYNLFSGRYAVIAVDNVFSKGKFEQTLDLVRLHNQPEDNLAGNAGLMPGQQFFRLPDYSQVKFPQLTGFSSTGLPAGSLLTGVLAGGTGALSGIASTVISNGINAATNIISKEITGLVNSGVAAIGDWWNSPSISWDNIGTGGFENLAGGGASEGLINTGGISGLSDWGTVNTGQLIDGQVSSMSSGLGGVDLGTGGLDSLPSGVDLGGIF